MQTSLQYDIIICGAGPAGTTCALALGDSGLRVALLDKSGFPREKTCGGAVAAYVPKVLQSIHPRYREALERFEAGTPVDVVRLVSPDGTCLDLPSGESGFIAARLDFDHFLLQQVEGLANVDVLLHTELKTLDIQADRVQVGTADGRILEAALVIGCDGAHSAVLRHTTATRMDPDHYLAAVRAYFRGVRDIPRGTFELHFLQGLSPGYFWVFPLPQGRANVGLCAPSSQVARDRINLRREMERIIREDPAFRSRFEGAEQLSAIEGFGLPVGSRRLPLSGHRFMLCGDAASLIDPASGEGIGQGMISGRYAGWHARKCFERGDFSATYMRQYDRQVYAKLGREFRSHYLVRKWILARPWLFNALMSLAAGNAWIRKLLHKAVA